MIKNFINFLRLTRPLFLLGGIILYLLGTFFAQAEGYEFKGLYFIIGQILITAVQLMTHYINEYFDLESDAINQTRTWFSGGSGALTSGAFSPAIAWRFAVALAVLAAALILYIGQTMPVTALICILSLGLSWFYSAPPLRLCATGAGELSASLVVTMFVPIVGYSMQSGGKISLSLLILCIPLFLIHFAMLISFQIPDYAADLAVKKKTISVRLGLRRAIQLHNGLLLLAYSSIGVLTFTGWITAASLLFLPLPLAIWQSISIHHYIQENNRRFLPLTIRAIALFGITSTLYLAAYFII